MDFSPATQGPVLEARYIERANQVRKCNLHESKLGFTKAIGSLRSSELAGSKPHLCDRSRAKFECRRDKATGIGFFTFKGTHFLGRIAAAGTGSPPGRTVRLIAFDVVYAVGRLW